MLEEEEETEISREHSFPLDEGVSSALFIDTDADIIDPRLVNTSTPSV